MKYISSSAKLLDHNHLSHTNNSPTFIPPITGMIATALFLCEYSNYTPWPNGWGFLCGVAGAKSG